MTATAVANAKSITDKFRQLGNIPTLPNAASRAMAIVNDPNCNVKDFCKVIDADAALATSLLKLVNSSLFGGANKINNLHNAVTRLGLRETQNLILAVGVRSMFRNVAADVRKESERLWQHCSLTAVICRQINQKLGMDFNGEEFTAGICHDIGRVMLAIASPESFRAIAKLDGRDENAVVAAELKEIGFDHASIGCWLMRMWNLPEELIETTEYHHKPASAPKHSKLAAVVSMSEELANYYDSTQQTVGADLSRNVGWLHLKSLWSVMEQLDLAAFAEAVLDDAIPEFQAMTF